MLVFWKILRSNKRMIPKKSCEEWVRRLEYYTLASKPLNKTLKQNPLNVRSGFRSQPR